MAICSYRLIIQRYFALRHAFHQPQCLHHGFTRASLCSPLYILQFILHYHVGDDLWYTHIIASVQDLSKCSARRNTSYAFLCLKCYPKCLKWLQNEASWYTMTRKWHTHFYTDNWGVHFDDQHSVFSVLAGLLIEMLFTLFSIYNVVQWGWKRVNMKHNS